MPIQSRSRSSRRRVHSSCQLPVRFDSRSSPCRLIPRLSSSSRSSIVFTRLVSCQCVCSSRTFSVPSSIPSSDIVCSLVVSLTHHLLTLVVLIVLVILVVLIVSPSPAITISFHQSLASSCPSCGSFLVSSRSLRLVFPRPLSSHRYFSFVIPSPRLPSPRLISSLTCIVPSHTTYQPSSRTVDDVEVDGKLVFRLVSHLVVPRSSFLAVRFLSRRSSFLAVRFSFLSRLSHPPLALSLFLPFPCPSSHLVPVLSSWTSSHLPCCRLVSHAVPSSRPPVTALVHSLLVRCPVPSCLVPPPARPSYPLRTLSYPSYVILVPTSRHVESHSPSPRPVIPHPMSCFCLLFVLSRCLGLSLSYPLCIISSCQ